MTGYSAEEFIADPRLLAQLVHPEDVGLWRNHQQEEALAAPESKIVQFRIRRRDGGIRWVEHACQSVLEKGGAFLGIRASNRDITDRKEEEMQIQMLQKELAHVTRVTTLGQLTASLAHELNQPLTAILCNAQSAERFLASDQPDLTELRETLADIRHDSRRAGGVIQRLRALFHKTGQERSVLQLNDLIKETLGMLRSEFVLKGAALLVELAPELPGVLGNRIELQQVVLNLILNALEAMARLPRSTRQLHISTERESPTLVRASFRDSGPGISEPQLSRLFEPFFTTKPGGMGMGLSICQSIIEAHDGRLWVVNNPDRGATFHFALPLPPRDNA